MNAPILDNTLADMAETAGTAWRSSQAAARESVERAIEAGYVLVAARNRAGYGEWGPFLDRAGIPERQAQRLMQLARSFVQPDTVSALGGVKATLAALGRFRLPEPGQMVLVDNLADPRSYGFVWPSAEHDGFYNIIGASDDDGDGVGFMSKPVAGPFVFTVLWFIVPPADEAPIFLTAPEDEEIPRLLGELLAADSEPIPEAVLRRDRHEAGVCSGERYEAHREAPAVHTSSSSNGGHAGVARADASRKGAVPHAETEGRCQHRPQRADRPGRTRGSRLPRGEQRHGGPGAS